MKATVFIPTWYGEQYLDEVLTAIFDQRVDFEYEVLVYDTSSKDSTVDIIKRHESKHDNLRWKSITPDQFGHGKTRNAAAYDAKGEIVVYISQDVTPSHDRWLYEMVKPFELNEDIIGVMGKQIPRAHCFPLLKVEILRVFAGFGPDFGTTIFYNDDFVQDQGTYDAVSFYSDVNSAARKKFLVGKVPYQDVPYAEDQLFGRDIINKGYKKAYAPRASVFHSNEMKLSEYKNRMFDETIGLRKVGIPVQVPGKKLIVKMIVKGVVRDWLYTLTDKQYSAKRKVYWLLINPLFHIEKWKGIRTAAKSDLDDEKVMQQYSLERLRNKR